MGSQAQSGTTAGAESGYQGDTFLQGFPIIGQLLDGAAKNHGAGSTTPPQLQPPGQVPDLSLGAILGRIGQGW